jgi:hypothetical protein
MSLPLIIFQPELAEQRGGKGFGKREDKRVVFLLGPWKNQHGPEKG